MVRTSRSRKRGTWSVVGSRSRIASWMSGASWVRLMICVTRARVMPAERAISAWSLTWPLATTSCADWSFQEDPERPITQAVSQNSIDWNGMAQKNFEKGCACGGSSEEGQFRQPDHWRQNSQQ